MSNGQFSRHHQRLGGFWTFFMVVVGSFNGSRRRTPRRPVWIKTDTKNSQSQKSAEALGRDAAARLFSGPQTPNAIFCGNDQITGGACNTLREIGLAVPADVAIVGFDNLDVMVRAARSQLTSIDVNLSALGHEAVDRVLETIAEGKLSGVRRRPCSLVVRASSKP